MANLTLSLFGRFQALLDDQSITDFETDKGRALLAYLAVEAANGGAHSRSTLAALLWPDYPEESARTTLRHVLHCLRATIHDAIEAQPLLLSTRQTLQLNPAVAYTLDVATFTNLLAQCAAHTHAQLAHCQPCLQQLQQAVALYRGDFLADLSFQDSGPFEEWRRLKQEQYHIQVLDALFYLTHAYAVNGDHGQAAYYARRQLELEPWREGAHRQLMRALACSGQRSAAIAQYQACRQVLSIEFGAEPEPATTVLYEQVKTGTLGKAIADDLAYVQAINGKVNPKVTLWTQEKGEERHDLASTPEDSAPQASTRDWGDAPEIGLFHGRQAELNQLAQWLVTEQSRLVTVVGMGGMGKTALAARLTRAIANHFTVVIWRSLLNAPSLVEIIRSWIRLLAGQDVGEATASLDLLLNHLFELLRERRCLLVLDNAESILQGEARAGHYRPGYEGYGQLFQRFGAGNHQSCLLITSREQPHIVARLAQTHLTVHTLYLTGLTAEAGVTMIETGGVRGATAQMEQLVAHYSGNPLALMLVAETIQELYAGDLATFLGEGAPIFGDIRDVLDEHIARLLPLERDILLWLAIERQPLSAQRLAENLQPPVPHRLLLEALGSLRRRSLLEKTNDAGRYASADSAGAFALQNVVTEYLTHFLIEQILREVEQGEPFLLKSHALLMAQAKAYVRQVQRHLILQPIGERLRGRFSPTELAARFKALLASLRTMPDRRATYAGGNLLNLLLHLGMDPSTYDFSQLAVWQADLQRADLPGLNLAQTDLRNSLFAQDFIGCHALAFAPTGHLLAGGMTNGEIHLWRPAHRQLDAVIKAHTTRIWAIAFSPDGQLLASGSKDCTVRLWDAHTHQCRHTLIGHTDWVRAVAFHPNSQILASGGHDQTVRVWDVRSGRTVHVLRNHTGWIMGLAFSPDGALLASTGTDQTVRLWDVQTGAERAVLDGHSASTVPLCFSPDGAILATAGYDQTICLWELAALAGPNNPAPRILAGHKGAIYVTAFSPDGRYLFSAGHEELIYVWDVATGQRLHLLAGHSREVNALAVHPTGTMLATSETDTSTVYLWELDAEPRPSHLFSGYRNWANAVAFHPHLPLLASAGPTEKVHLWDALMGQHLQTLGCESGMGLSLAFGSRPDSEDDLLALGSIDHTVWVWPIPRQPAAATGQRTAPFVLRTAGEVRAVAFRGDGRQLITGGYDGVVRIWDAHTGQPLRQFTIAGDKRIKAVAISADGCFIAAGSHNSTVTLWHVATGEYRQLQGHTEWVWAVTFHPSGILASGSFDRTVRLWDVQRGAVQQLLSPESNLVQALAFNQAGTLLAVGAGDATIYVWDARALTVDPARLLPLVYKLQGHVDVIQGLAFSSDDRLLASASKDRTVKVWDTHTGECCHTLQAPGPYAGMNITGVTGITAAQKAALKALGAVDEADQPPLSVT